MTDVLAPGEGKLDVGFTAYHMADRDWVRFVVSCQHGQRIVTTNHDEDGPIEPSRAAEVIDRVVRHHRDALWAQHNIACTHPVPRAFTVDR